MSKNVIEVDHLKIRFNMATGKVDNLKEYAIKLAKHQLMFQEFIALQDITFQVKKGEAWGLVGPNGCGKSTLLKAVSGILQPYEGTVKVKGKISPLIELGAGFDKDLTARENIYLNGLVLGHSKKFMEEHFDEIVEFADIENFLDAPLKNFSSGMKARLGFAVATVVNPDILIVDEVLEVGDMRFRRKCNERMQQMLDGGTTLLYVSHNIESVKGLCDKAIWIDHGKMRMIGKAQEVCDAYQDDQNESIRTRKRESRARLRAQGGKYDYLVVGAGLTGAVFAREMAKAGKRCLVIDKRSHVGGNVYTEDVDGIQVHRYGPHVFHTDNEKIWKYVNRFADFNRMIYAPLASYGEELYNLPLNMNTFNRLWNLKKPQEVKEKIAAQIVPPDEKNALHSDSTVEEQALSLVGTEVYEKLIKGYMEKLWGKDCKELPASLLPEQPLRFTYDNRCFDDRFQGIPVDGYTALVEKILENTDVMTDTDFFAYRREHPEMFKRVFYTGGIDAYFDYCYGHLEYRSARYETERVEEADYQGNAVVLDMNREVPYTRVMEYKHFAPETEAECPKEYSIISREYPQEWRVGTETNRLQDGVSSAEKNDLRLQDTVEPYDPVRDEKNIALYEKYRELAAQEKGVIFGGRLGTYQHLDMDQAIAAAMELAQEEKLRFQKKRGKDVSDQAMD